MAVENGPFVDDLPFAKIKSFFFIAMLTYQKGTVSYMFSQTYLIIFPLNSWYIMIYHYIWIVESTCGLPLYYVLPDGIPLFPVVESTCSHE